jgi:signal transduction histidine kinase
MNNRKTIRVLIAEDDHLVSKVIKTLLKELAYTVVGEAADGVEAVEMACTLRPDVILMDIEMAEMDGLEATRLIRERRPTPVVVLTAYETEELVREASAAGAGAYLVKPPNACEIERAIVIAMARFDDMMALQQSNRRLEETLIELEATREKVIQQERLAVVSQLAVGIAHEFNNILAALSLYTEMSLREPGLSPRLRERLDVIAQQILYATDLVQQIVDFGQRAMLDKKTVDVGALLKETVALLERTVPQNIKIELTRQCPTPVTIHGDPTRVRQAVVNLALNARDAMPEGGELHIGLERVRIEEGTETPLPKMQAGEWVRVTVTDTGTGIPPDVLPHLYEPFFTTRAPLGHGLGLPQAYGIVKQHNGHIGVETQVGEGTTFSIYLPAESPPRPETPPPATTGWAQGKRETILVVEDDAALRAALVDYLHMLNYQTLEASSGCEALTVLKEYESDALSGDHDVPLVLSDWIMPGMSGRELAWELKQHYPGTKALVLTDHSLGRPGQAIMPDNVVDWVQKPIESEQLAQLLRDILTKT